MPTIKDAQKWYQDKDPVHGLSHVLRVYALAEVLADAEGADIEVVRAAALLHDAEGPGVGDSRLEHQHASAQFAEKILSEEGWSDARISEVQHCIRAHRFRDQSEQPQSIEAKVLFDADKLDAIGAVGAVRAIAYAVLAGQDLYAPPSAQFILTGEKESGEPHTPYHEHLFKLKKIKDRMFTDAGREVAVERHAFLDSFFAQLAAELQNKSGSLGFR